MSLVFTSHHIEVLLAKMMLFASIYKEDVTVKEVLENGVQEVSVEI